MSHTTATARDLLTQLRLRYQTLRHHDERLETHIREILSGRSVGIIRLNHLRQKRDDHYEAFHLVLRTAALRVKDGDKYLQELLQEKFKSLNQGRYVPLATEEEE